MTRPTTVDDYLVGLSDDAALRIDELRELSRRSAPGAEETIKWGSPAMVHPDGTILFVHSAHKHHANVTFTPSTRKAFARELREYATGEGIREAAVRATGAHATARTHDRPPHPRVRGRRRHLDVRHQPALHGT